MNTYYLKIASLQLISTGLLYYSTQRTASSLIGVIKDKNRSAKTIDSNRWMSVIYKVNLVFSSVLAGYIVYKIKDIDFLEKIHFQPMLETAKQTLSVFALQTAAAAALYCSIQITVYTLSPLIKKIEQGLDLDSNQFKATIKQVSFIFSAFLSISLVYGIKTRYFKIVSIESLKSAEFKAIICASFMTSSLASLFICLIKPEINEEKIDKIGEKINFLLEAYGDTYDSIPEEEIPKTIEVINQRVKLINNPESLKPLYIIKNFSVKKDLEEEGLYCFEYNYANRDYTFRSSSKGLLNLLSKIGWFKVVLNKKYEITEILEESNAESGIENYPE